MKKKKKDRSFATTIERRPYGQWPEIYMQLNFIHSEKIFSSLYCQRKQSQGMAILGRRPGHGSLMIVSQRAENTFRFRSKLNVLP